MTSKIKNIIIDQGADFSQQLTTGVNLTSYSLRGQIRKSPYSIWGLSFTCAINTANTGVITYSLPNYLSRLLEAGNYVYDIEAYTASDASVIRLVEGLATVTGEVTKY